ncbi:MAG: CobD/CbiB family protein [Serpentinimonas sp.]|jgi:adenosylcobinamide-phosphate synthase|nr:CobD/CbiB family protein [Serpentinimonas sp.]
MNFFAVFIALLLEQARPLGHDNVVQSALRAWTEWVRRVFDAGQHHHGWLAWLVAAALPAGLAALVYWLLSSVNGLLGFLWVVLVLYGTVGFRQFSHHFTSIREALEAGDENAARTALARWQRVEVGDLPRQELLRHVIEHSVLAAHRHVFGVLVCFVVLSWLGLGPAGAVLYRLTEQLAQHWKARPDGTPSPSLQQVAASVWHWLDYVPARVTALAFAVVGNFEEAVASWRQDAARFSQANEGVVLAATAGAINVRLGGRPLGGAEPSVPANDPLSRGLTDGREPQLAHLASVVGLVWRSVVLWLLVMALMMLAQTVA